MVPISHRASNMIMSRPCQQFGGLFGVLGLTLLLNSQQPATAQKPPSPEPLLVSAAISLTNVLQGLAPAFSRSQRVPPPQFNLGASGTLQRQIEQGAPVDVFLSAGTKQMDALEQAKLLQPGTRRNLISNQLVLVVPAQRKDIVGFADLDSSRIRRIAIGDNAVPAGDYARQVLRHYKLSTTLQPKLVPLGSVRAVAAAVASGNADAGLVYRSDTFGVSNLRIAATAPAASHSPILYSGAVIRRSRQPAMAKAYLDGLQTPAARSAFIRAGFSPLPALR
jgi:molybdate transport system substrate-binding protein